MSRNENNLIALARMGISDDDARALRRISMTLRRWHEHECNGTIQRDQEIGSDTEGTPRRWAPGIYGEPRPCGIVPDRERGALKRLAAIMARYPTLQSYVQGDPRGCALYLLRPGDEVIGEDGKPMPPDCWYSRGVAVY